MIASIFETRMDVVYFVYGAVFLVLAGFAGALRRDSRHSLPWLWLQAFGLTHGFQDWLLIVPQVFGELPMLRTFRLTVLLASFLLLLEFGRAALAAQKPGSRLALPLLHVPLLALAALGALAGPDGFNAALRYALALPASLLAAAAFWRAAVRGEPGAPALRAATGCLLAYGLLAGLLPAPAPFFPASVFNSDAALQVLGVPIQVLRAVAIAGLTASVWRVALAALRAGPGAMPRAVPLRIRGTVIGLVLAGMATCVATEQFGAFADRDYRRELRARAQSIAATLEPDHLAAIAAPAAGARDRAHEALAGHLARAHRDDADIRNLTLYAVDEGRIAFHVSSTAPIAGAVPATRRASGTFARHETALFATGRSFATGPLRDDEGPWIAVAAPAWRDPATGRVLLALGMDVDAGAYRRYVGFHRLAGVAFGILLTALLLDFFSRHHRLWLGHVRLAESEARYRALSADLEDRVARRTDELADANRALRREIERHRASELKYRTLTDQLPAITYTVDFAARPPTTFISPQVAQMTGYTAGEWLGDETLWPRIIHPDDRERVLAAMRHGEQTGEPFDAEYRLIARDGRVLWIHNSARYAAGADGRPASAHGVMLDITDRVLSAQEMHQASERYRLLFENAPVGVYHFDTQLRITQCNERFLHMGGVDRQAVIGMDLRRLRDASILPALEAALAGHEGYYEGLYHATLSEHRIWIGLRTAPLVDNRGEIVGGVAIVADLTERQRLDEERIKSQKLESLGLLAGGIAHDFNNILTAILGNVSMVKMAGTLRDRESIDMLSEAERAALRAKDLTQQLLTFAKGGAPVKRTSNVGDLVRDAASFTVRGSASRLTIQVAGDLWTADVDPGQVGQVVQNLVINADQAMPNGGAIAVTADNIMLGADDVPPLAPGPYVRVSVADTGLGIAEQHLSRIFDPYFTTKHKGSGLGLTTSFSIVRRHGGHITVRSRPGEGTTFTFFLPARPGAAATDAPPDASPHAQPGRGRVLVMDDEAPILGLARRLLERSGYDVTTAPDGEAAIAAYAEARAQGRPFAVAVLDVTIPGGLGGRETFARLRQMDPGVRAVVSSGYSTEQIMAQFRALGFAAVVPKPYAAAELLAAVRRAAEGDAAA